VTLIDTHAHLDSPQYNHDREQIFSRALSAGVAAVITVGTDLESSHQAVDIAQGQHSVYAAVGIHPHEAAKSSAADLKELERLCQQPAVVALGEMGLDFYRNLSPAARQREVFVAQLELARQLRKAVIVHDRQAHAETMAILREQGAGLRGVLHCFSGDADMAWQAIRMGFYVSIAGPVTFQNARKLHELARQLPLESLLVETDCPYLAPHPHRGQRNEPAYVRLVAEKIAALRGLPLEQVAATTTDNARQLFGLP